MATDAEIEYLLTSIAGWLGARVSEVDADPTGSLAVEFGNPLARTGRYARGEWSLWASFCEWRIEQNGRVLAGRGDSEDLRQEAAQRLQGQAIRRIELKSCAVDAVLYFEDGLKLRLFCTHAEQYESWQLFTPDHRVLAVGPGDRWALRDA